MKIIKAEKMLFKKFNKIHKPLKERQNMDESGISLRIWQTLEIRVVRP